MMKLHSRLFLIFTFFCLIFSGKTVAETYTAEQARLRWEKLKVQPINETSFRKVCDLAQDVGKQHLEVSYEIFTEFVPLLEKTGNKGWIHIILMSWAKAKGSLHFFEEAEILNWKARRNALGTGRMYREALVQTVLMYGEWGKADSSKKYIALGEKECIRVRDVENLSFIYTFKAVSPMSDSTSMHSYLSKAIALSRNLPNKNALFTARYNYANFFLQDFPVKQVEEYEALLELARDSSLSQRPKRLYERTAFVFRNPASSVYYHLMQLNLLLTDFKAAGKFATLFYDAVVKPNPEGVQAPYYNAEMSIVKSWQHDFKAAREFLEKSRKQFKVAEDKIPYISYFIAAGMIAEHEGDFVKAESYYKKFASNNSYSRGFQVLPVELNYANMLTHNGKYQEAEKIFSIFRESLKKNGKYSVTGFYYSKYWANYLKARNDYKGYIDALETYYEIKDSLTSLNKYRSIQEIMAKVRIRDKEQQIQKLSDDQEIQAEIMHKERIYYGMVIGLSVLTILSMFLFLRSRMIKNRQKEALQNVEMQQSEKQRHIDLMAGIMQAEESERKKIAGQLHDEVSSMLALALLSVSSTLEKGRDDGQAEQKLIKTQEILSSISGTFRNLSHQLNPLQIEKYGFATAILNSAETINLSNRTFVKAIVVGFEDTGKYNTAYLTDLYRIVQELLHNILKHAGATEASLEVIEHDEQITIIVEDNGIGLPGELNTDGQGLNSIRSKVAYLNGKMEIGNKPEGGVMVVVEIYLKSRLI